VEVIRHQTIGQNIRAVLLTIMLQPRQEDFPIVVGQKNIFPAIAALGNVMGYLGKDGSRETEHTTTIPQVAFKRGASHFFKIRRARVTSASTTILDEYGPKKTVTSWPQWPFAKEGTPSFDCPTELGCGLLEFHEGNPIRKP